MKVVVYGEFGQYCTDSSEIEVETVGTPRALKSLANKYKNEWAVYGDNWSGWLDANVGIFIGTMKEFRKKYNNISDPHYITGATYRVGALGYNEFDDDVGYRIID